MPHLAAARRTTNEKPHPVDIDLLGTEAIVHVPNALAQLVQHTGELQRGVPGFMVFLVLVVYPVYSTNGKAASHFQENLMSSLWSNAQLLEQVLLWTLDLS